MPGLIVHRVALIAASVTLMNAAVSAAQVPGSSEQPPVSAGRAPYLTRGDEVEKRYELHRKKLEAFFVLLQQRVANQVPSLLKRLEPPAPVPYGYQILPALLPDKPGPARSRILLSPFSWSRTEKLLDRDRARLDTLDVRLPSISSTKTVRQREYRVLVEHYKKLLSGQKLIANQIQYNRFWQGDIASHPVWYGKLKELQKAALERQALADSLTSRKQRLGSRKIARMDSLTRQIEDWVQKAPAPKFVVVDHPDAHHWVVHVRLYTDIQDSSFVERSRTAIENGWHVKDGKDDFRVRLDVRRVSAFDLYPDGRVPERGAHIDVDAHVARFPQDGVVLTTGSNALRALARAIVLAPFTLRPSGLVHEFGHMLGFKDGYFRSYDDRGPEGYEVLEVILPPEDVVAAPENGHARREHFAQLLLEKRNYSEPPRRRIGYAVAPDGRHRQDAGEQNRNSLWRVGARQLTNGQ